MPRSSAVVAGNPALASQFNNVRLDAIAPTVTFTAGENFNANTPVTAAGVDQGYSLPTLLYESGGKVFKMPGTTTNGARLRIYMAAGTGNTDSPVTVYTPGGLVPVTNGAGSPSSTDLGRNASNSTTAGATELTTRPPYYTIIGYLASTDYLAFIGPVYNNTFWKQIETPVTSGEAFSARDALYLKASDGRAYKADSDAAESGICEKPLFAAQAATGAAQTILAYTPGAYISGFSGLTAGTTYYPSSTSGALSSTKGTFSRGLLFAISSSEGIFMPNELEFLPPGLQETGVAAGGWQTDNTTWAAVEKHHYPIRFRKQMCNVPSSLTLSWATSQNNVTVTTPYINAYGASLLLATNGSTNLNQEVIRFGTYVTVGN